MKIYRSSDYPSTISAAPPVCNTSQYKKVGDHCLRKIKFVGCAVEQLVFGYETLHTRSQPLCVCV